MKAEGIADFYKFPRTHHIYDAGGSGVTRDDLDAEKFLREDTIIEEKIDGANLGISVTKDYEVIFQNSFPPTVEGFRLVGEEHSRYLGCMSLRLAGTNCQVLTSPDLVLFGEWCYARHSVPYKRLPSYFIAFDLYSKTDNKAELENRLDGTGIHLINKLSGPKRHTKQELLAFLEQKSMYRDDEGTVEGVYVRIDRGQWHESRGKIVRPDFIQNIEEHWMKSKLVPNEVRMDLY